MRVPVGFLSLGVKYNIRLVLGVRKFEPTAHDVCSRLYWLLPKYLYYYLLLINVYKVVKGEPTCSPSFFLPNFVFLLSLFRKRGWMKNGTSSLLASRTQYLLPHSRVL